jgi:hypothetical protein
MASAFGASGFFGAIFLTTFRASFITTRLAAAFLFAAFGPFARTLRGPAVSLDEPAEGFPLLPFALAIPALAFFLGRSLEAGEAFLAFFIFAF